MSITRSSGVLAVLALAWVLAVGAGLAALVRYEHRPGQAARPPSRDWPAQSAIRRDPSRATLVMLAHPRCPCTRASVEELARLMLRLGDLRLGDRAWAHVLFLVPPGKSDAWAQTDLWRRARAIPGVRVYPDRGGREARLCFGGATSGQTFLYDARGRLAFRGGITGARGHEGDNPGSDAVVALLRGDGAETMRAGNAAAVPLQTPVFGCALFNRTMAAGKVSQR